MSWLEELRYKFNSKRYHLYLGCRMCNQRVDTKTVTQEEAHELLKLWNHYHKDHMKKWTSDV